MPSIKCKNCDGQGRIQGWMDYPGEGPRCEVCKGHGELTIDRCPHCHGSGLDERSTPKPFSND